uniref:Uncharacterized protein n=1 Tax=Rhizophora mucronata TaxID=61149 RepID=A0A2P2QPL3_RHIMU
MRGYHSGQSRDSKYRKIMNAKQSGLLTLMVADFKLSLNDYLNELVTSPYLLTLLLSTRIIPDLVRSYTCPQ